MKIIRNAPSFQIRTSRCISHHRSRAKEAGQTIDYSLEEFRTLVAEALKLPCRYCGGQLWDGNWSADHKTPTSRGGSFCGYNVEITCKSCNTAKGALTTEEFSDLWDVLRDMCSQARTNILSRLKLGGEAMGRRLI